MPPRLSGRHVVVLVMAASFAMALACNRSESSKVVFTHGVAAGDVQPDGAVLWTRVDREAEFVVQVATDDAFEDIVLQRAVSADASHDFVARTAVDDLEPAATYYYRFRAGDRISDAGTFLTAPAETAAAPVRFVFSGDSDGTVRADGTRAFDFAVLTAILSERPDFFVYEGDTIYADSPYGTTATMLDAFRAKYKENREIESLRQLLAGTSTYAIWDDHEVQDDFEGTQVDPTLFGAGKQAFSEYMPLAGDGTAPLYRSVRWGTAIDLIVLDTRSYRDQNAVEACTPAGTDTPDLLPALGAPGVPDAFRALRTTIGLPAETDPACLAALNDPQRTMLGTEQKQWLLDRLQNSEALFQIVINPEPISELLAQPYDRWEGYRAERDEIVRFLQEHNLKNVIFLSTDWHANVVDDVRLNLAASAAAVEFVTGPIAHTTLGDDIAAQQGDAGVATFETLLKNVARVECADLDAFSYGVVDVDPTARTTMVTLKDEHGEALCTKTVTAS